MHYSINSSDSFSIPTNCIAKVFKRNKFMGWFNATYVYAQQQAQLKLKEAIQTLVWLETHVENENRIVLRPNKIAEDLGVTVATVYNHLQKIKEADIIVPDPEDDNAKVVKIWRICPFHAWRGKSEYMAKYLSKLPANHVFFKYMDQDFKELMLEEGN